MGRLVGANSEGERRWSFAGNLLWLLIGSFLLFVIYCVIYAWMSNRAVVGRGISGSRLNRIGEAMEIYLAENDERFPGVENWDSALSGDLAAEDFLNPYSNRKQQVRQMMNSDLSHVKLSELDNPYHTAMIFIGIYRGKMSGGMNDLYYIDRSRACVITAGNKREFFTQNVAATYFPSISKTTQP